MMTQEVRIPRWRAVVLCLAGVLAMIRPLAKGISLYRATLPAPVNNYSALYGWVEESGPFNSNERWRAEQRLRVLGYPREKFTPQEIERAAADVRALGLAEIQRVKLEEMEKARRRMGDRAVAVLTGSIGAAGVLFYMGLGYTMLHEAEASKDASRTWLGRKKRHGRITFGGSLPQLNQAGKHHEVVYRDVWDQWR
jgi:hypothetical protein